VPRKALDFSRCKPPRLSQSAPDSCSAGRAIKCKLLSPIMGEYTVGAKIHCYSLSNGDNSRTHHGFERIRKRISLGFGFISFFFASVVEVLT
jgi:hypothetical protein